MRGSLDPDPFRGAAPSLLRPPLGRRKEVRAGDMPPPVAFSHRASIWPPRRRRSRPGGSAQRLTLAWRLAAMELASALNWGSTGPPGPVHGRSRLGCARRRRDMVARRWLLPHPTPACPRCLQASPPSLLLFRSVSSWTPKGVMSIRLVFEH